MHSADWRHWHLLWKRLCPPPTSILVLPFRKFINADNCINYMNRYSIFMLWTEPTSERLVLLKYENAWYTWIGYIVAHSAFVPGIIWVVHMVSTVLAMDRHNLCSHAVSCLDGTCHCCSIALWCQRLGYHYLLSEYVRVTWVDPAPFPCQCAQLLYVTHSPPLLQYATHRDHHCYVTPRTCGKSLVTQTDHHCYVTHRPLQNATFV